MKKYLYTLILTVFCQASIFCQEDPVLFKINSTIVKVSEFSYIYEKNNRENADYSLKSLEEYLGLYVNFKLKVQKAKDLNYHLSESYKEELSGYRKQLINNYLLDREVVDVLAKEQLERSKTDLHIAHILLELSPYGSDEELAVKLDEIKGIRQTILDGLSFEEAAAKYSEDLSSAKIGGDISYISGGLPEGFEELEDAVFQLDQGEISQPVRSPMGVHLLKLLDKRPARGNIELAHILIRDIKNGIPLAAIDVKLESIKSELEAGRLSFGQAAMQYSDDIQTNQREGYLGFVGISQYERVFEDAAFGLLRDGEISKPIKSSIGWHLIKRISKASSPSMDGLKEKIKSTSLKSKKYNDLRAKLLEEIKSTAGFKETLVILKDFKNNLDSSFYDYDWNPKNYPEVELFSLGAQKHYINDFIEFAKSASRTRLRAKGIKSLEGTVDELYVQFVEAKTINYAENSLESRYPDFKNLMREYEEGILLFEITKNEVWDKASLDTAGLKNYFQSNIDNYRWEDRAQLITYNIRSTDPNMIGDILTTIKTSSHENLLSKYNKEQEIVIYRTDTYERSNEILRGMPFKSGVTSSPKFNQELGVTTISKIIEIIPATPKSLKEAKGYVISDFQDQLEKDWIKTLNAEYKIEIDKNVLSSLIRRK